MECPGEQVVAIGMLLLSGLEPEKDTGLTVVAGRLQLFVRVSSSRKWLAMTSFLSFLTPRQLTRDLCRRKILLHCHCTCGQLAPDGRIYR